MEVPKDHITTLLDNDLFYSAQMLGCFLVSSAVTNSEASPYLKAENLVLQGDALFGEKEFRRALRYISVCQLIGTRIAHYRQYRQVATISTCSISRGREKKNLESSSPARSVARGRFLLPANCPYVLEAITALAELGVSSKEVSSLFPQRYVEAQCCIASSDYKVFYSHFSLEHAGGLDHLSELLQQFPNNVHILLEIAKVSTRFSSILL
ncbi:hypothetical protein GW17_00027368 [Ensete ventricosum]|nr:hypothetical protein GW17_00027368 [Ensete ventricosum]